MAELMARYSGREKLMILIGLLIVSIVALDTLVIAPYQNRVTDLNEAIQQSESDWQWMQSMAHRIPVNRSLSPQRFQGSLANLISETVKRRNLNQFLDQVTPNGEEQIRVRFNAVPFDQLVRFIAEMNDNGLRVKDLRINTSDRPAQVDSSLVLHKV